MIWAIGWLVLMVAFLAAEAATVTLVSLWFAAGALVALVAFVAVLEGYLFARISMPERALLIAAGIGCLWPSLLAEIAGVAVIVVILGLNLITSRRRQLLQSGQ